MVMDVITHGRLSGHRPFVLTDAELEYLELPRCS